MSERDTPQINASSMADIAFLLLIFFLVTTTLNEEIGIPKMLPDKNHSGAIEANENNILEIDLNANNEILIEGKYVAQIADIRAYVIAFIDNGGGTDIEGNKCDWCAGKRDLQSSDHPFKAIVKLQSNRTTSYGMYISVQNEIIGAYSDLRNSLAHTLYNKSYTEMRKDLRKDKNNITLKSRIKLIESRYPEHISEDNPIK